MHACSVVLSTLISPCCLPGALMRIHGDDMGSLIQAPGTFLADSVAGCAVLAVAAAADPDAALAKAAAHVIESLRASLQGAASSAPCSLHSSPQALSGEAGDFLPGASCVAQVPRGLGCARLVCGAVRLAIPLLSPRSSSEGPSSSVHAPPPPRTLHACLGTTNCARRIDPGETGARSLTAWERPVAASPGSCRGEDSGALAGTVARRRSVCSWPRCFSLRQPRAPIGSVQQRRTGGTLTARPPRSAISPF